MLARLTIGANDALQLSSRREVGEEQLTVNIDLILQDVAFQIPDAWKRAALLYANSLYPACRNLRTILSDDVRSMEQLFSDLEELSVEREEDELDILSTCDDELASESPSRARETSIYPSSSRIRQRSLSPSRPHRHAFTIPKIIITPCSDRRPEMSCRVPLQDSAYNQQLTVPNYTSANHCFPPMRPRVPSIPAIQDWTWRDGHWQATLPGLDEQCRKGMFSRPTNVRRRASRSCRSTSSAPASRALR